VIYDPDLLELWFFNLHDPTKLNRQGNDVGDTNLALHAQLGGDVRSHRP
jgi:peptide methionine sulfoxide reductase MsrA